MGETQRCELGVWKCNVRVSNAVLLAVPFTHNTIACARLRTINTSPIVL